MEQRTTSLSATRIIVTVGVLAALSIILVLLLHFPIFPSAAFLEVDFGNVPSLLAGFAISPVAGLVCIAISAFIQSLVVSSSSGIIGFVMHFIASGSYILIATLIYKRNHTIRGAVIGLACGTLTATAAMIVMNILLTPVFMGVPMQAVMGMIFPIILPFNILKFGLNSIVLFLLYKPLSHLIHSKFSTR